MGGGRKMGVILVLPGGDKVSIDVWSGVLGSFRSEHEDGGEYPCNVHIPDHGEVGNTASRKIMGYTGGQGGAKDGGDEVAGHIHRT